MISEPFIADLHIHSKYSRATSRNLDFENIYIWAQIKGITVVGTGDFTHPEWFGQILEKLEPAEPGLLRLKADIARVCDQEVPDTCRAPVRFLLSSEISNIYKKKDRTRKNHNLVFFPDVEHVRRFNSRLDAIGNIHSDGRPILGLDARDLLEIVLEVSDQGFLVPAHIWTPWFSMLGSKSGFDSIEACFEDLSAHIFAAETGLSSDPAMNWRVEGLDNLTLISNSDAHSPGKLGREANLFNTGLDYHAMRAALKTGDKDKFLGTFEFYPEEGKYHVDGHRKCGVCFTPEQTKAHFGNCPVCGKPLTLGVLHRVEELATREEGVRPRRAFPFYRLIPLEDLLSEILKVGAQSKKVKQAFHALIAHLGSEFKILHYLSREDIETAGVPLLGEAIARMRANQVSFDPGYDGLFGTVRIFSHRERDRLLGQQSLFSSFERQIESQKNDSLTAIEASQQPSGKETRQPRHGIETGIQLNPEQQAAVDHHGRALMIIAGPGTGKTRTLTHKLAGLIQKGADVQRILAVTFTNKAALEMKERLDTMLDDGQPLPFVGTFHSLGYRIVSRSMGTRSLSVIDEKDRKALARDTLEINGLGAKKSSPTPDDLVKWIVAAKQNLLSAKDPLDGVCPQQWVEVFNACYRVYQHLLRINTLVDFEDLIFQSIRLLENDPLIREHYAGLYGDLFIDEYQDINAGQYRLVRLLAGNEANVCIIGDPDQSIYGFRGSDTGCFKRFTQDYGNTTTLFLNHNYRSTQTILDVSSQVISHNRPKETAGRRRAVYSDVAGERTIQMMEAGSDRAEAVLIGKTIEKMVGGTGFFSLDSGAVDAAETGASFGFSDFAVLFRTRIQAKVIGQTLQNAGIPCQQVDRQTIIEHAGIRSLVAALKLIHGVGIFNDMENLTGLFKPPLSAKGLDIVKNWAYRNDLALDKALAQARRLPIPHLGKKRQQRLFDYTNKLDLFRQQLQELTLASRIEWIADKGGIREACKGDTVFEKGLLQISKMTQTHENDWADFLATLNLSSHTDMYDQRVEKVALMTMHAAKGLEFPVVFIAGCEDEWIPYRSANRPADVEEERRLFYVAMTRAKRHLILTKADRRRVRGRMTPRKWSLFVKEIENNYKRFAVQTREKASAPNQEQLSLF